MGRIQVLNKRIDIYDSVPKLQEDSESQSGSKL